LLRIYGGRRGVRKGAKLYEIAVLLQSDPRKEGGLSRKKRKEEETALISLPEGKKEKRVLRLDARSLSAVPGERGKKAAKKGVVEGGF